MKLDNALTFLFANTGKFTETNTDHLFDVKGLDYCDDDDKKLEIYSPPEASEDGLRTVVRVSWSDVDGNHTRYDFFFGSEGDDTASLLLEHRGFE